VPPEHGDQEFEVEVESQISPTTSVKVRGSVRAPSLEEALKKIWGIVASAGLPTEPGVKPSQGGERRFPQELLPHLSALSNKDFVALLLYFEGPMSREQISQRSRELGKTISKTWLDTEFFRRPVKDLFIAETDASGSKVYRLTEVGRVEAEGVLARLRGKA
jgi:hypothetical protein